MPVVPPQARATRGSGAPPGGGEALIAAVATRNAATARAPPSELPSRPPGSESSTAPKSNAVTARAPRVARTAPLPGSVQPWSQAAAPAASVQPRSVVTKPLSEKGEQRPGERELQPRPGAPGALGSGSRGQHRGRSDRDRAGESARGSRERIESQTQPRVERSGMTQARVERSGMTQPRLERRSMT